MVNQLISARHQLNLSQEPLAQRMAIYRLESARKHEPSLDRLRRYAEAVNCELRVTNELEPH